MIWDQIETFPSSCNGKVQGVDKEDILGGDPWAAWLERRGIIYWHRVQKNVMGAIIDLQKNTFGKHKTCGMRILEHNKMDGEIFCCF